jgi:hypothetical protein
MAMLARECVAPATFIFGQDNHAAQRIKPAAKATWVARAEQFEPFTPALRNISATVERQLAFRDRSRHSSARLIERTSLFEA